MEFKLYTYGQTGSYRPQLLFKEPTLSFDLMISWLNLAKLGDWIVKLFLANNIRLVRFAQKVPNRKSEEH